MGQSTGKRAMKVVWSMLTLVGALSATEASAANWGVGLYVPVGIVDQLHLGTAWQRDGREHEPAPIVLAEARKAAKHGASGAAAFNGPGASLLAPGTVVASRSIGSVCGS